jgi:hypothetical protein
MRIYLTVLILIFSLQSLTKANDIRDFEIEGMSIGDSLLDYFSESEIKKNSQPYYKNKKYTPVEINRHKKFKTYYGVDISFLTNDPKYKIKSIKGVIDYRNKDMKQCKKELVRIANEISSLFVNFEKKKIKTFKHIADPTGKSKHTNIAFISPKNDIVTVFCTDYSVESGWMDHLGIAIKTEKFNNFLSIAYK